MFSCLRLFLKISNYEMLIDADTTGKRLKILCFFIEAAILNVQRSMYFTNHKSFYSAII